MANLFQPSLQPALDGNGATIPGAKLYFYLTGTTTLETVYTDQAGTTAATNPVVADGSALFEPVYLDKDTTYRVILKSADDSATVYDVDPVRGFDESTAGNATAADAVSTAADAAATAADAIATAADRVQTGLDRVATAADAVSTAADVVSTTALKDAAITAVAAAGAYSDTTLAAALVTGLAAVAEGESFRATGDDVDYVGYYTDLSGVATETVNLRVVKPSALNDAVAAALSAKIYLYSQNMKSAVGDGSLKVLWDMDGPRTAYSSSSTIMTALTSIDASAKVLGLHSFIAVSGPAPRPVYTSRGISLSDQAGFQIADGLLSTTNNDFAIMASFDLNLPLTTVATEATLPGSPALGDIVKVNADANTTVTPDIVTVLDQQIADSLLVNGYFVRGNGTWRRGPYYLFAIKGVSSYIYVYMNHLGQLFTSVYSGAGGPATIRSLGSVVFGQDLLTIAIRRKGSQLDFIINGEQVYGYNIAALANITDFANVYINGNIRSANTTVPIGNGIAQYFKGMAVADDLSPAEFQAAHDVFAKRHGSPLLKRPRRMRGIVALGQSWTEGAITVTDTYTVTTKLGDTWNGEVSVQNTASSARSGENNLVTRESFPNLYSSRSQLQPADIAPIAITINSFGSISTGETHIPNSTGENFAMGMMRQINVNGQAQEEDWIISGIGAGGNTIAGLSAQTNVPLIQNLKTVPQLTADYYNKTLRQLVYARDFAYSRGQDFSVDLFVWQQGHSDMSNSAYATDFFTLYDRLNTDVKRITGQSHDIVCLIPQVNYSTDGAKNRTNVGTALDQIFLDIEDARGTRPIFGIGPMYQITSFIHPYRLGHRIIGEIIGQAARSILFDGEQSPSLRPSAYTYAIGGTTIDIDYKVRTGRALTLGQTSNNVDAVLTYQGYEYYRKNSVVTITIASPGVVTWAAHGLVDGNKIKLDSLGELPTGYTKGVKYFVVNAATDTFQLALTLGGAAINTSGTQSSTHYAYEITVKISSVALGSPAATRIRVTLDGPITSGGVIKYTGPFWRYGNVTDGAKVDGIYQDQDWTVAFTANEPIYTLGDLNDVRLWACASTKVLT